MLSGVDRNFNSCDLLQRRMGRLGESSDVVVEWGVRSIIVRNWFRIGSSDRSVDLIYNSEDELFRWLYIFTTL